MNELGEFRTYLFCYKSIVCANLYTIRRRIADQLASAKTFFPKCQRLLGAGGRKGNELKQRTNMGAVLAYLVATFPDHGSLYALNWREIGSGKRNLDATLKTNRFEINRDD